ncbi:MAG: thiamine pyrophosphate-binding protein, partial [Pseudomonadales bacterium]
MNGAQSLVQTLVDAGVTVCFTNPGTSEMHFVAALDDNPEMRCVLGLFEGVVSGAADGYARMADRPAATLLHLGPGLGNALANLHNAKKAGSGVVNIALEGILIFGALGAAIAVQMVEAPFLAADPNAVVWFAPWVGVLAAMLAGGLVGAVHAVVSIRY